MRCRSISRLNVASKRSPPWRRAPDVTHRVILAGAMAPYAWSLNGEYWPRAAAELAWVYWNADEPRTKALGLSGDEINAKLYQSLARASTHPSPTYYQIAAQLLACEHKSDEAIAGLLEAVALDPSDPWGL
jgi:hypothetical protein